MSGFFEILWKDFITNLGQLQFFIYMWLAILAIAVLRNNVRLKSIRLATMYSVAFASMEELARSWHFRNVLQTEPSVRASVLAVMAVITFLAGMWGAYFINVYMADRRVFYRFMSRQATSIALWFLEKSDNYTDTMTDKLHAHLHKGTEHSSKHLPRVHQ